MAHVGGSETKSVLFVCLGNICRSPMAEAVFQHLVNKAGQSDKWCIDSAAMIDYHVGKLSDHRTISVLSDNGISNYKHVVRELRADDFDKFDFIFGMDHANISDLNEARTQYKKQNSKAKIELLGSYDPALVLIIKDPYYGNDIRDFKVVYEQCVRCCQAFLEKCS